MLTPIDTWGYLGAIGGVAESGAYVFDGDVDLGAVFTSRLTATLEAYGFDASDLIDSRASIDTWASVDGGSITDVAAVLQVRTTDDDPAGTPVWGAWTPFVVADFTCRALQFKLVLSSIYSTHNIAVSTLTVRAKEPI
jgi:hypothetical protein